MRPLAHLTRDEIIGLAVERIHAALGNLGAGAHNGHLVHARACLQHALNDLHEASERPGPP